MNRGSDAVHWFLSELGARIVAETGIPSDRHHIGKLTLQSLKDAPDFILQIDGATGESETFKSVLERSVRCATCFRKIGLQTGDNIVLMAPNHLDLTIPLSAALYNGIAIASLDAFLEVSELESMFKLLVAKVIFCQNERAPFVIEALKNVQLNATIVTFDDSDDCISFSNFMEKYGEDTDVENFKATDFDPAKTLALLVSTSGTTGLPKSASHTHKNLMHSFPYMYYISFSKFPTPTRLVLVSSPLQWLSAMYHFLFCPILRYTRLQTTATITEKHFVEFVNKYRPSSMIVSPNLLTTFTKPENMEKCDITCFDNFIIGGSAVSKELMEHMHKLTPNTQLQVVYGFSEAGVPTLIDRRPPLDAVGRPYGLFEYRLVDVETKEDITVPYKNGELWLRGPSICKGYYNNPEVTKESFEGDWIKTGDVLYRDENYYFYFVERLKLLLKYRNHQISPLELETVIRQHPGVLDVAVTGIPHWEHGELPVACVVSKSDNPPTAQEIKNLVKNTLTDTKQLRGGVIFMRELPMTSTIKVHRTKLREMVLTIDRE